MSRGGGRGWCESVFEVDSRGMMRRSGRVDSRGMTRCGSGWGNYRFNEMMVGG